MLVDCYMAKTKFNIGDELLYIGDNDQWKSMIDIVVYAITTENYIIIYRWTAHSKSKPKVSYGLAEFAFHDSIVKHFVTKNKVSKVLYESKE